MTSSVINLLLAVFLLAANAFFVAAEFALVKSRGFRIDALAEENQFGARLVQRILRNIEAYLACCQLGITMASLGLGWVGEPTVAALLHPVLTGSLWTTASSSECSSSSVSSSISRASRSCDIRMARRTCPRADRNPRHHRRRSISVALE